MLESLYIAQVDANDSIENIPSSVIEKVVDELQKGGLFYTKTAGRFEITKKLPEKAETFDEMFDYADAYGNIRLAYIYSAHKIGSGSTEEKEATALGGTLGINTATYNGFGLHIAGHISQKIGTLSPSKELVNEDFFNTNRESMVYIAESSLKYNSENFSAEAGRIVVETPYANSDDIRMAANTFEGASLNINYNDNLRTQLMYINKWAGYDSQDEAAGYSQDEFKKLVNEDGFGMATVSLIYTYAEDSEVSFWYNHIDEMCSIAYAEIVHAYNVSEKFRLDYGFQYSHISELANSDVDGDVFGAMGIINYDGFVLGAAYNLAKVEDGKYVTNGFGGGPYFTSLDEATMSAISEIARRDTQAYRIGAGIELDKIGLDGFNFEAVYGELSHEEHKIVEKDFVLTYLFKERWFMSATYANYEFVHDDDGFDRYLVKIDYSF